MMNRDDIICMAIDAGARMQQEKNCEVEYLFSVEQLERLLAAENEACAQIAHEAEPFRSADLIRARMKK